MNQFHLALAESAACRVEEDEVVANRLAIFVISAIDIKFIERRFENIAPQSPSVVGKVVVADNGVERELDIVVFSANHVVWVDFLAPPPILVLLVVLIHIIFFGILNKLVKNDVIFRFRVGYVAQMTIEQVVVLKPDAKHFVHAAPVGGQMAVGSN